MESRSKPKRLLFILAASLALAAPAGAADCRTVWVSGTVDDVDWVGRKFSLSLAGYNQGVYIQGQTAYGSIPNTMRFLVDRQTSFVQQTSTLSFSYLEQSDDVSVLCCLGDFVDPVAIRVVINNSYPK